MQLANIFHFFLGELKMKAFFTLSNETERELLRGKPRGLVGIFLVPGCPSVVPAAPCVPSTGPGLWWEVGMHVATQALAAGLASAPPALPTPQPPAGACAPLLPPPHSSQSVFGPSRLRPQGLGSMAGPSWVPPTAAGADGRTSVNIRSYSKCWISFIVKEQILILMLFFVSIPGGFIYFSCFLCKLCRFI